MKYVLYGLPCAGKTTLLSKLTTPVIHGSTELSRMASGRFSDLPDDKKAELRVKYAEWLSKREDSFISDGHYSFLEDVVFTEADGSLYDVFMYLYCDPESIAQRIRLSPKNERFSKLSVERIRKWQNYEIECLRKECHNRNKDFYVIHDITSTDLQQFIEQIESGFSSYTLAESIVDRITSIYSAPCELYIVDGDKTIIEKDSFRVSTNNYITHAFDGNFYTGYQSMKFSEETESLNYNMGILTSLCLNDSIYSRIADKNYVILSSGVQKLWDRLSELHGLRNVIASTLISADTKYFVVKLLQGKGYRVIAYGDGKNDYYMLRQADMGYIYIGSYLSRSLRDTDTAGINLIYDKSPYILAEKDSGIEDDIAICKSDSAVNGAPLADAHIRLGKMLGEDMREIIPHIDSAIIVLERGGRFFGDGVYMGFGGTLYSYNPKNDELPDIQQGIAVIVDSVINTGKSILDIIAMLKQRKPEIEIVIVSNVIQEDAINLFQGYKVFAVRTSANSFVGSRQATQKNGKGPDTADRLFNYID
ncbi:MAG: AAA family ATPase [Ruminococcus sp.]